MGKKKNKQKFKPVDLKNLPTSSNSTSSSKTDKSIDRLLTPLDELSHNESKNDIKDGMCKSPRSTGEDHKVSKSVTLTKCSEHINTRRNSDEVVNKLEHVTLDSQNTIRSGASNHAQRQSSHSICELSENDAARRTRSYDRGGKSKNYANKILNNLYYQKNEKKFQRGNYRNENQYKYEATCDESNENKNMPWISKKSHEYRNRILNFDDHIPGKPKQDLGINKVNSEAKYQDSASGLWEELSSKDEGPSYMCNTFSKEYPLEQTEQENWDEDSQNGQESFLEDKTIITEVFNGSWDKSTLGNNSSKDDTSWDDEGAVSGMELNVQAKTFVPVTSGREMTEIYKGETDHTKYTVTSADQFFNNYQHKPDNLYKEKKQRRGASLGQNYHSDDCKGKETSYQKRRSEGNWEKQENSRTTGHSQYSFDRSCEKVDVEYRKFQDEEKNSDKIEFVRVVEIQQDLFALGKEYSLAHCVAEDMRMGSGIAVSFKRDFKDMDVLLNQKAKQGGLAFLTNKTDQDIRYIYYLVTKRVSNGKPTYETLWSSLKKMRGHIMEHNVRKLAIPRLGCGLDRLEWARVKHMIEFLFKDVDVEITVCNFQQAEDSLEKPLNQTCKVVNVKKSIADIEEETTIIYLSTEDGHVSTEMEQLSKKFAFLDEFRRARKQMGDLIKYQVPKKYYVLYGCIVRKTKKDPFDFVNFRKCVSQIDRNSKKDGYFYVAIQAIRDNNDDLINHKLVTILRNYLHKIDVYVCWHGDLIDQMPMT